MCPLADLATPPKVRVGIARMARADYGTGEQEERYQVWSSAPRCCRQRACDHTEGPCELRWRPKTRI